jgi:hypothetical protein
MASVNIETLLKENPTVHELNHQKAAELLQSAVKCPDCKKGPIDAITKCCLFGCNGVVVILNSKGCALRRPKLIIL